MGLTLGLHIAAGALGIASGLVALSVAKGARLHRRRRSLRGSVVVRAPEAV